MPAQMVAFVLFMGAILLVTYLIRVRKREAPPPPTQPKKLLLGLGVWLIVVYVLATVWGNRHKLLAVLSRMIGV